MIKIGWILIRVPKKPKFKIGNLQNTENITLHYITYKEKKCYSPSDPVGKQTHLIKSKARLDMRVTIRFSFHTPHSRNVLMCCQTNTFSTLIAIWKFDSILWCKRPLNVIFKTVEAILSGTSSHFSDTTSSIEQNLPFTKLA